MGDLETPKRHFEINWPLNALSFSDGINCCIDNPFCYDGGCKDKAGGSDTGCRGALKFTPDLPFVEAEK